MKAGARVLGIDDSPFTKKDERVLVVGVVWRSGVVEGVLSTYVRRDGLDSTEKIERMVEKSKFRPQIKLLVTHGLMLAGFNIVDVNGLSRRLSLPVIAVTRKRPHRKEVRNALKKFTNHERRWKLIESAGKAVKMGRVYAQLSGISERDARSFLSSFESVPEPVRLAHLIGSGIIRGESHGKV